MVQPDYNKKEVMLKIVYYGAPGSGKKSNLAYLSDKMDGEIDKKNLSGYTVHTLEYNPKNLQLANMKVRCILHAISSEVSAGKTGDYFQGVDGVVLVADSQSEAESKNTHAVKKLKEILQDCDRGSNISIVFQWNKQDLPDAITPRELNSALNDMGSPSQAACANQGDGVLRTLDIILDEVCGKLEGQMKTPSMRIPKKKLGAMLNKARSQKKEDSEQNDDQVNLGKKWKAKKEAAKKAEQDALEKAQAEAKQENKEAPAPKLSLGKKWKTKKEIKKEMIDKGKPETEQEDDKEEPTSKLSLGKKWKAKKAEKTTEDGPKAKETTEDGAKAEEKEEALTSKLSLGKKWKAKKAKKIPEDEMPADQDAIEKPGKQDEEETKGVEEDESEEKEEQEAEKIESDTPHQKMKLGKKWEDDDEIVSSPKEKPEPKEKKPAISPPDAETQEIPIKAKTEKKLKPLKKLEKKGISRPKLDIAPIEKTGAIETESEIPEVKPARKPLPKTSTEQATAMLLEGKSLENMEIDVLNLSDNVFEKPVRIIKCRIKQIQAQGCDFKSPLNIEHTTVDILNFSGEISSLFRDQVIFKNVNIPDKVNLESCIFNKGLIIEDSTIANMVKMQSVVCEEKFSIISSKISGISCQDSQFRGNTTISGGQFENVASFQKCAFYGPVTINSTNFQRAHFMDAYCKGHLELARCIFEKSGNFGRIQCEDGISLEGCVCNGVFNLGEAYLKGRSRFRRTEFCNDASFSKMLVSGPMVWEKVSFASLADFSAAHFAQTEMKQNTFYGTCNFQESIFTETLSLLECVFEQPTHFSRAMFLDRVDLRMSQWKDKVSFANIIGDYISLNREQVEGKLLADFQKDQAVAEQEYLTLKGIFSRQKQFGDCDWAHYHARRAARKKKSFSILHPLRSLHKILEWLFLDLGCKYGTRPFGLLVVSLVFIAIFAGVYATQFPSQLDLPQEHQQKWTQAVWQSFIAFSPGGSMHWKGLEIVTPFSRDSLLNILLVVENLLGFFLLFLFLLMFTRKLLQD